LQNLINKKKQNPLKSGFIINGAVPNFNYSVPNINPSVPNIN